MPILRVSRREAALMSLSTVLLGAVARGAGGPNPPPITRPIPASGEHLPVIGVGTNRYDVSTAADLLELKQVLSRLSQLGSSVVDTAPLYGRSEAIIGDLSAALGNRDRLFLASKVIAHDTASGEASLANSLKVLRTPRLDLLQVHNLLNVETMLPLLQQWKQAGRIRYTGITTSNPDDHPRMMEYMRRFKPDFIQVDYSLGNRGAADAVLPLAQQLGIGVVANMPFGGRRNAANVFARVADKPLPPWTEDIQVTSWSQFFLKYVVSHPAVTCTVPGTTSVMHLADNTLAGRGSLPDAALRRKMEQLWDGLPG